MIDARDMIGSFPVLDDAMRAAFARSGACVYSPAAMSQAPQQQPRPEAPAARTIVLVGLMGVGKTTVGRRLAARLHLPFIDADHEIEQAAGMTISEMFERFGEAAFRDGERRVIARLIDGSPRVLATGGGAFMHPETRALILDQATAVWLDADIDVIAERVGRREGRPLLKGRDPREVLSELAATRNPVYALAPIHVRSQAHPHEVTVETIIKALGR